jgi:hypothetical protein
MKLNFLIDKEQDGDFIYSLANKNMSEWAVDLETAQAMAQDIVAYSAEIARLKAICGDKSSEIFKLRGENKRFREALKVIADFDDRDCDGCQSCIAKIALE